MIHEVHVVDSQATTRIVEKEVVYFSGHSNRRAACRGIAAELATLGLPADRHSDLGIGYWLCFISEAIHIRDPEVEAKHGYFFGIALKNAMRRAFRGESPSLAFAIADPFDDKGGKEIRIQFDSMEGDRSPRTLDALSPVDEGHIPRFVHGAIKFDA
ncbi:MAG: hypothetical protein ING19_11330, partial [Azospirillum sp.]|nr:hypothetical protein [Azospirillum sp.]